MKTSGDFQVFLSDRLHSQAEIKTAIACSQ